MLCVSYASRKEERTVCFRDRLYRKTSEQPLGLGEIKLKSLGIKHHVRLVVVALLIYFAF